MSAWRDIQKDPPPKDGTRFLAWSKDDGRCFAYWHVNKYPRWKQVDPETQKLDGYDDYTAFYGIAEEGHELHSELLTHWQPLPKPPADGE